MMLQKNIAIDDEHWYKLKTIALNERITMKELLHNWIDDYPTWPAKYQKAEYNGPEMGEMGHA